MEGVKQWFERSDWQKALAFLSALIFVVAPLGITGCHRQQSAVESTSRKYDIRGTVVRVDQQDGQVTLQHDAIPGLMEAMTMPYPVTDRAALSELHPGDASWRPCSPIPARRAP